MKKNAVFAFLATSLLLSGCASNRLELMGGIDPSEKTISAPPGSMAILGPVKRKLVVNGWKVDEFDQVDTRYKVTVNTVRTQLLCWNEWSEVFRITGESCDSYSDVGDAFEKALKAAEDNSKNR